jgi:UDP-GlcNAc3NAcA epimerase
MKVVSIVGARPQFIKLAPLAAEIASRSGGRIRHFVVHTGQHYDANMSDVFFDDLHLPDADFNLEVGSGSHGRQTGQMLEKIERVIVETEADAVVVYGDTNSTLAGALAAAKLRVPSIHAEAGLRSFNRAMPEEINRIAADHVCDLLLSPTPTGMRHLAAEGLATRSRLSGDLMYDAVLFHRARSGDRAALRDRLGIVPGRYAVATLHRAENTDDPARLAELLAALGEAAERYWTIVFPIHPRTRARILATLPGWTAPPGLKIVDPVGYLDMLWLLEHATAALTDSGGLQKEAMFLDCPCITLRDETEWDETVAAGANRLAGAERARILAAVAEVRRCYQGGKGDFGAAAAASFGGGRAASNIYAAIESVRGSGAAATM